MKRSRFSPPRASCRRGAGSACACGARDEWNLLDPLVLSWHPDVGRDKSLIDSLIEARRIIEPEAAALAAMRATADDLARIEEA